MKRRINAQKQTDRHPHVATVCLYFLECGLFNVIFFKVMEKKDFIYLEIMESFEKLELAQRAEVTMFLWGKLMKECNAQEMNFNGKFTALGLKVNVDLTTEDL